MSNRVNHVRILGLSGLLALAMASRPCPAQVAPADFFKDPLLILAGPGHNSFVRSMAFTTRDGSQLLTGGMDKVIHVWNLDVDRSQPARTLRPPHWRGFRGQVNALALPPGDEEAGQRTLAVAGYGVLGDFGEILLFRFPDPTGQGTGEIVGQLAATTPGTGHEGVVTSLAFTPKGRYLASASNDRTVRIWDVEARRMVSVLSEAAGPVNTLAIFAEGKRLVAGGRDGSLRLYDISNPTLPRLLLVAPPYLSNAADPFSGTINTLSVSADGLWILVGTEGGRLTRFDARTLAGVPLPNQPIPDTLPGPVEAVAIHPDNTRFAVSVIPRNLGNNPADLPTQSCVVEIRALSDGRVLERTATTQDLVMALAFSPDGQRLAFSGGNAQSVFVRTIDPNASSLVEIPGQGSSLWDVGFRVDGQAIRFARSRPPAPGGAADYEAFHLRNRFLYLPEPGEPAYQHALASDDRWTIRPISPNQLAFVGPANRVVNATLDPDNERRWFCYTVIRGNPAAGHPDPVAAVGCGTGVACWNLRTGEPTRFFTGHAGPVYGLAPSVDGKWLVTGSSDQTARIWPLAGVDRVPAFGARFGPLPDGRWSVAEVTPGGFADGIKLRPGHVIEKFYLKTAEQPSTQFANLLLNLDAQPATRMLSFEARMGAEPEVLRAGTTKRDSPGLSIFPAANREWVMWTPRGHYDTSAAGDRKFLGWLTNQGAPNRLLAGRFDTIDKFEARYRQPKAPAPNALDGLLDTGDPIRGAALAPAVAPAVAGPDNSGVQRQTVAIETPPPAAPPAPGVPAPPPPVPGRPVTVREGQVTVRYDFAAAALAANIARATIAVEGRTVANLVNGAAVPAAAGRVVIPLPASQVVNLALVTEDARGVIRTTPLTVNNQAPPKLARRPSRLEILAIGPDAYADARLPTIRYASGDARALADFLKERLVDPATGQRFAPSQVRSRTLVGKEEVAIGPMTDALDDLRKEAKDGRLGPDDVVAVVIESHFFTARSRAWIATAEPENGPIPAGVPASELADRLGELSRLGCRVFAVVDAVHEVPMPDWDGDLKEWIRQLQSRNNVAVFVASGHGPSRPMKDQRWAFNHRAFADGILTALDARAAARLRTRGPTMSLADFQQTVIDTVLSRTGRKQHVGIYLPETLAPGIPFLETGDARPAAALNGR